MAMANVVGMMVAVRKEGHNEIFSRAKSDFGKKFYNFPDEHYCEAHYKAKMLTLDGSVESATRKQTNDA